MVEALAAIDRQLEQAAQPLERADADLVIAALEQDPFGHGLIARLSGRYRGCRTERAIAEFDGRAEPIRRTSASSRCCASAPRSSSRSAATCGSKALLEVWLYVHVPVTVMLLAALTAHIVSVFYYW